MDDQRDKLPGEGGSQDTGASQDSSPGEGQSLWRLLNEPGQMATDGDGLDLQAQDAKVRELQEADREEIRRIERGSEEAAQRQQTGSKPADATPARDEHWSQIRKILETPDEVDESFDLSRQSRTTTAQDSDGDPAILAFMRDETLLIKCRKHPTVDAKAQCPECQAYYCSECLVVRKGRLLCRDCAETIFVPTEEEVLSAAERGGETAEEQVMPTQAPEFQIGSEMFGLEGAPSNPLKQLIALAVDLVLARGVVLLILWLLARFTPLPEQLAGIFRPDAGLGVTDWLRIFLAGWPPAPWSPVPFILLFFCTDYLYYFFSLGFANRTPGMSALGCRIATVWGDFVSFGAVAMRTLLFLMQFQLPAVLVAFFLPNFRGLHDLLAGTIVINYAGVKRVDAYETIQIKL